MGWALETRLVSTCKHRQEASFQKPETRPKSTFETAGSFLGTPLVAIGSWQMSDQTDPDETIVEPLTPKSKDGLVEVRDPPADPMTLTPDAAEITGIRLLDAADQARKRE